MGTKHIDYKPAQLHDKGKWFVWFSFRDPNGNFKRFKVYEGINRIEDLKERREFAALLIMAVNTKLSRGYSPFTARPGVTLKSNSLIQGLNYFKQSLYDRGLRKRTIQSYESVLRSMYDGLRGVLLNDLSSITKQQITSYLRNAASKNEWSNSTYNNNLTFVRAIFNYLVEHELLETNPATKVKPLPQSIHRHRYFDDETFEKIKNNAPPDLLRFLMFLYHTGTRPNEARQLRYENILTDRRLLFIPASISKNKKDDYVPLTDYIIENFKGEGFIFGSSVNYFTQKFHVLKKRLNLPKDFTMYAIKHTRAMHLAQDGASPYAIMELFRHSGLDITMSYLRGLGHTVNREAADKTRKW